MNDASNEASFKNRFGLEGRVALIAGGAQGHGLAISRCLGREGMKVVVTDNQKEKGEEAVEQIKTEGGEAEYFFVDLRSQDSIREMIGRVKAKYSELYLLVNNVRPRFKKTGDGTPIEDWGLALDLGLSSYFYCAREVISVMEKHGRGSIINISSIVANYICYEQPAGYHVAKAGINQLTRCQALTAGPKGIRVNSLSPGHLVKTEDASRYEADTAWKSRWEGCIPLGITGRSDDLCNAVLFLASDLARFITGQDLVLDGGMTLAEPGSLVNKFANEPWC